jgi:hypothetical protein
MSCIDCENHHRWVSDAERALAETSAEIKRLDLMTYTQVYAFEQKARELKQAVTRAKSTYTRHRNKCPEAL